MSDGRRLPKWCVMHKRGLAIGLAVAAVLAAGAGLTFADRRGPADAGQAELFAYAVTSFACDTAAIGGARPTGKFCTIGITVYNRRGGARKPGIEFATAYDANGAAYLADPVAEIRAGSALLDDLAAGGRIDDRLIYDVPARATLTRVLLRASPASAGVSVPLGNPRSSEAP